MFLEDAFNLIASGFIGFCLWLIVTPFRLVVALLGPVFLPVVAVFDPAALIDGMQPLRGFFTDVNYFLPFFTCVVIIRATLGVMFLYTVARGLGTTSVGSFVAVIVELLRNRLEEIVDVIKRGILAILKFFLPSI